MALDRRQSVVLESVRRFLRRSAYSHLIKLLAKARPQDFPSIYEALPDREGMQIFRLLAQRRPELGADLLVELPHGEAPAVVRKLGPALSAELLAHCAEDDTADVLAALEEEERQALLEAMRPEDKLAVEKLLLFDEETAGRIMTTDVFALHEDTTVGDAITELQAREDVEMAFYLYVVDERRHLVGVLSLRQLLLHPPETRIGSIMNTDLLVVRADADQEEVARVATKYDLIGVPVVDDQGRLAGMVTIDDVIDVMREEATEDIFRMAGTSEAERVEPSIVKSARVRSPWLLATFVGGLLASFVIGYHEEAIQSVALLAAFLPIVLGMAGSAGNQTATVMIRGLATGRIHQGMFMEALWRESGVAVLLGLLYGVLLGLGSWVLAIVFATDVLGWWAPAVIGLSLTVSMLISTTIGAVFPLVLERIGGDPAVSTTPFVTTATDVFGSLTYLGLVTWLLF
jgi:magnesium transporter